jgi:hypothetical protein
MGLIDCALGLRGVITERELPLAEQCFPGIGDFYRRSPRRWTTFLELVWAFLAEKSA